LQCAGRHPNDLSNLVPALSALHQIADLLDSLWGELRRSATAKGRWSDWREIDHHRHRYRPYWINFVQP
jgi:hypothetical protein